MEAGPVQESRGEHANGEGSDGQEARLQAMPFLLGDETRKKVCARRIPCAYQDRRCARQERPGEIQVGMIGFHVQSGKREQQDEDDDSSSHARFKGYLIFL